MKITTRSITLAATLAALCFVTGLLPYVFFLPVVVAATTLSLGMAAFVGLAFGLVSILYSFTVPMSAVAIAFVQAPYIAIIPRMLAAIGCCLFYKLMLRLVKPQKRASRVACVSAAAAAGSILNTALVVGLFAIIMPEFQLDGGVTLMLAIPTMLISGAIECVCMAVIAPAISLTLDKVVLKKHTAHGYAPSEVLTKNSSDADLTNKDTNNATVKITESGGEA